MSLVSAYLQFTSTIFVLTFTSLSFQCGAVSGNGGDGKADDTNSPTVLDIPEGQTSIVSCASFFTESVRSSSIPENFTDTISFSWTAPPNVNFREPQSVKQFSLADIPSDKKLLTFVDNSKEAKSWIELDSEGNLIFHSPKVTANGRYNCHIVSGKGTQLSAHSVLIRVENESEDDGDFKIKVGLIAAGALIVLVIVVSGVKRYCQKRRKKQYIKTLSEEKNKDIMRIPTIMILDVHGEKIAEEVF